MTKNGIVLTVVALLLACVYVYFFTNLLVKPRMQIIPVIRPDRPSSIPRSDDTPVYPVMFKLDREYRLTSVKVLVAAEAATNKYAPPLWHMVAESQSVPTDSIIYGGQIKGMKPKVPRARPSPLEPNVPYLLVVEAGNVVGRTNFVTKAVVKAR